MNEKTDRKKLYEKLTKDTEVDYGSEQKRTEPKVKPFKTDHGIGNPKNPGIQGPKFQSKILRKKSDK